MPHRSLRHPTLSAGLLATTLVLAHPAGAQQGRPSEAASQAPGRIGVDLAARAGELTLPFEELDDLLIWRDGRSPDGRAALRQLLELRVIEQLADEQGLVVSDDRLSRRWSELDKEIRASGVKGGVEEYLQRSEVSRETFLSYLRLALLHEALTRQALKLGPDQPVSGDQQTIWLRSVLDKRPYQELPHPWSEGVVARSGDVSIRRAEFAEHLRSMLPEDQLATACFQLLLEKRVRQRMPDLAESAVSQAVQDEIDRRRAETEGEERFEGIPYESLLDAQGLSIATLRRDPAVRVAALAHLWVDRTHDEQSLRRLYEDERDFFDGLFGEGVEVFALMLSAARFKNHLVQRTFEQAEQELIELRGRIHGLEDFQRQALLHSEDAETREKKGRIGIVTRGALNVPDPIRVAAFTALAAAGDTPVSGTLLGPVRIQGGAALLCLGERRPAPSWPTMATHVHRELRRRFLDETLSRGAVTTWLDTR